MRSPNSFQNAGFATVPLSKEVDKVLERDPYRKVGLFGTVEVRGWRWVVGCPIN